MQLLAASTLIAVNWGTYIYAVNHGHVVDAALGYFINPLVTVALGVVDLPRAAQPWQFVALIIAVAAVAMLTARSASRPYIGARPGPVVRSLRAVKKVVDADPRVSVAVETLWATPVAVGFLIWAAGHRTTAHFANHGAGHRR